MKRTALGLLVAVLVVALSTALGFAQEGDSDIQKKVEAAADHFMAMLSGEHACRFADLHAKDPEVTYPSTWRVAAYTEEFRSATVEAAAKWKEHFADYGEAYAHARLALAEVVRPYPFFAQFPERPSPFWKGGEVLPALRIVVVWKTDDGRLLGEVYDVLFTAGDPVVKAIILRKGAELR